LVGLSLGERSIMLDEDFFKDYHLKQYKIWKNTFLNLPTWSDIIDNIDFMVNNHEALIIPMDDLGLKLHGNYAESCMKLMDFAKDLEKTFKEECSLHHYISFSTKSKSLGLHTDPCDVFFLQAIGKTEFTIAGDVHILEPGDLLYIPPHTEHCTKPLTPRVGLSYGVEKFYNA